MPKFFRFLKWGNHPVVKSLGIYTFTNFLTKSTSFLLLFIFTNPKYITPAENGMLSLFNNCILFLRPLLAMGIIHSAGADFFKMEKEDFRNSFTSGFLLSVCATILSLVACVFLHDEIKAAYGFSDTVIYLIPLTTFFIFCIEQLLSLSRSNNDPVTFLKTNLFRLIVEMGLSVLLVVVFAWHWQGRVAGYFIAHFLTAIFAVVYFLRMGYLKGKVQKKYIKSELVYAVPVIAFQYCLFALYSSDKFFLSYFSGDGNAVVGIYSVASIFGSVIFTLHNALNQYMSPRIYSILSAAEPDYSELRRQFGFFLLAMGSVTVLMIIGTPVVYHFFINAAYHPALQYFYLLCLGYFLWALTNFFYSFLLFRKHKRMILFISLLSILIGLGSNYYFIRHWGAFGAGVSVFLSFLTVFIITLMVLAKDVKKMFSAKKP